jgi:hypothetical protein
MDICTQFNPDVKKLGHGGIHGHCHGEGEQKEFKFHIYSVFKLIQSGGITGLKMSYWREIKN